MSAFKGMAQGQPVSHTVGWLLQFGLFSNACLSGAFNQALW